MSVKLCAIVWDWDDPRGSAKIEGHVFDEMARLIAEGVSRSDPEFRDHEDSIGSYINLTEDQRLISALDYLPNIYLAKMPLLYGNYGLVIFTRIADAVVYHLRVRDVKMYLWNDGRVDFDAPLSQEQLREMWAKM